MQDQNNKKFESLATEVGKLVDEKNRAYGDSFMKAGEFLKILYPNGIPPEKYIDALCIVRMFDKFLKLTTGSNNLPEPVRQDIIGLSIRLYDQNKQA